MFVLVASAQVKPNAGGAFAQAFEQKLLPSLRMQGGLRDEMLLVVPGGPEIVVVTLWDSRENMETGAMASGRVQGSILCGRVERCHSESLEPPVALRVASGAPFLTHGSEGPWLRVGRAMTDKGKKSTGGIVAPPSDAEPLFVWNDRYALGSLRIDEEHKRLFDLANRLHSSIVADESPATAKTILVGLSEYARRHFDDEEARLIATACPYLSKHRAEHRLFVMTLTRLQGHEDPSADDAFCLARDWILEHILGMDRQHSTWMLPPSITPP